MRSRQVSISSSADIATTDTLDLGGLSSASGHAFTTSTNPSGANTTLTVTDSTTGKSATVTLAGNYTSAALAAQGLVWSVSADGSGGVNVTETGPTADNWNDTTGNWTTASDWSTGALPGSTNEAVLGGSTTYTVTLTGTQAPFSVSLNDAGATLNDQGVLELASSLTVTAGTFALTSTGTVQGGTIEPGSGMTFGGGTLKNVTFEGTINLTPAGSSVIIAGGSYLSSGGSVVALTTEGAGGSGPGVISIGSNGFLYFDDSQTFSNATITLEGNGAAVEDNVTSTGSSDNGGNPEVLTFGPTLTIIQNAGGDTGYIARTYDDAGPSEIINQGAIEVEAGTLVVEIDHLYASLRQRRRHHGLCRDALYRAQ